MPLNQCLTSKSVTIYLTFSFVALIVAGCNSEVGTADNGSIQVTMEEATILDALDLGILAHGGLSTWQSFGTLEYEIQKGDRKEQHLVDLHTRRTIQSGTGFQLGYDGNDVWVAPGLEAFSGNPLFSRGLDFYFFAIPFVLADPGTNREDLGRVLIDGNEYDAVKVSFDAGVGDSSNDYYIAHFHPETHRLHVLLYTATFRSQQPSENYNARVYDEWQEINGLWLPKKMTAQRWDSENKQLGEKRGEALFDNIRLQKEAPEASLFTKPEEAQFASTASE